MCARWIWRISAASAVLATAVPAATAQLSNITATGYTGLAVPMGTFADYATVGASAGLQVEYPIRESLAVLLHGGMDNPQSNAPGLPDFRLWRYQAGVAADLLGRSAVSWSLRGHLGAGGTTFRTGGYYPNFGSVEEKFRRTYFTGSGGLALVFGAHSPVHGYLGARLHWTPVKERDWASLRSAALGRAPDPVNNALAVPITLGLRVGA